MGKINYSKDIYVAGGRVKMLKEIITATESSPTLRHEVARVFQMANRRIQNVENAGLFSPAVASLNKGDIQRYSKFSMKGSWTELKIEYGKAISFLRQPTSTAKGTKQYNTHLQKTYDLTADEFNLMSKSLQGKLNSISESDFVEKYLMRYKDFTGELEQSARDISQQIESDAVSIARMADEEIERAANVLADNVYDIMDSVKQQAIINLKKFGL